MSIIDTLLHKAFGSPHERKVKNYALLLKKFIKLEKN